MSNLAVFNNFKPVNLLRNRYLRGEWAIWNANLHHGDIRPFACPELMCENVPIDSDIFPVIENCCCLTLPECVTPIKGFCRGQYFWIDPTSQTLRQSTEDQLCNQKSCRAGSPVPEPLISVEAGCEGDNYDDEYRQCVEQSKQECSEEKQAADDAYEAFMNCLADCENEQDCGELRKTWQQALTTYHECLRCLETNCTQQQAPCDSITVHYVITYVTRHSGIAVESSPSRPKYAVTNGYIPNATLTLPTPPDDYCIDSVRIYRVESDFQDGTNNMPIDGSDFVLVAEVSADTTTFIDDLESSETGYPLTTSHPMNNPAPTGVKYVARTEDGIVVADDCQVYISVSGEPQFGFDGVVSIENTIRDIQAIGNKVFVFTDYYPVLIDYRHTDGVMTVDRQTIQMNIPLRSRKSVSVYGNRIYFASEWSLYVWDTGGYGGKYKKSNSISNDTRPVEDGGCRFSRWGGL